MNLDRRPTYRATLEGNDVRFDLHTLLAELVEQPSLTSHASPSTIPYLTISKSHSVGAALTSPYRKVDFYPKATPSFFILSFSKRTLLVDLLGVMDTCGEPGFKHRRAPVQHLEIDLLQPTAADPKTLLSDFTIHDLTPLVLFRHLTYLKVQGMTRSYQSQIWQCVWLNPCLCTLILSMSIDGEILSSESIGEARLHADLRPSMRQVCHGHHRAYVPEKLSVVKLELTKFSVGSRPFEWFNGRKLTEIRFIGCEDMGFRLVGDDWRTTTVVTVSGNDQPEQRSTNLMSPRKRRPSQVDREGDWRGLTERDLPAFRDS